MTVVFLSVIKQPPDITRTVLPHSINSTPIPAPIGEKSSMRGGGGGTDCESAIYAECQLQSSSDETGSTVGRGAAGFQLQRMATNGAISSSASATPKKSTTSYITSRTGY
jgi:hypothetical protein